MPRPWARFAAGVPRPDLTAPPVELDAASLRSVDRNGFDSLGR